ncbi:siderophore-interacting protein [Pseudoclavibacter endophyticus]|uniref:Sigma-54 factor interaction domain-containing protein n=1 Tax=Pseudoclavibacter endophyticus TaxID=1778590 RepID=A0A6H9WQ49_9MICO|nr:helix-turn-helix domain-containing protein [Pseudoclavibacter endophyticus]KAB1648915.1 hypothetical protein F8O04_01010 [Pseudoclavibacter endophyticus]GGA67271.1 siderophore-interacting protein [Pseudoclavibacter endophyticus]
METSSALGRSRAALRVDGAGLGRLRRAREAFFANAAGARDPGLRTEISQSWRRSLESGVDPNASELPLLDVGGRSKRLRAAAEPVMRRLGAQLEDSRAWMMLLDRECALLSPVVGDTEQCAIAANRGAQPGALFSESKVGTNGSSIATERFEPFVVVGPEHFRECEQMLVSVGAPIRDAQGRHCGSLMLLCRVPQASSVMLPFTCNAAADIEDRLRELAAGAGRELLARYSRLSVRPSRAAIAVGDDLLIANRAARQLTAHGVGLESIAQRALDSAQETDEPEFEITSADGGEGRLQLRVSRVTLSDGSVGAIAHLLQPASPARRRGTPNSDPLEMLRRARRAGADACIVGEAGSGRRTLAVEACAGDGVTFDARLAERDPDAWLMRLRNAAGTSPAVVIAHLDQLAPALAAEIVHIAARSSAWFVATVAGTTVGAGRSPMDDHFAVVTARTPLRERRDEFRMIVARILAEVGGAGFDELPTRCSPDALAALSRQRWPGNVSQLRRVLLTAAMRASTNEIRLEDIPPSVLVDARAGATTKLERLERETILEGLRDAAWNRDDAARSLGISRATLYRKLKQFEISIPSSRR